MSKIILRNDIFSRILKGRSEKMIIDRIALFLSIVGGLNWGSIGFFGYDFVAWIFGGQDSVGSRIIYSLVGVAAIWCISLLFRERTPILDSAED